MSRAEYMREWRAQDPQRRDKERRATRARTRAIYILARRHPEEFERLFDAERLVEGLPPVHVVKRGRPNGDAA